ncbi:MAG: SCO family protein [Opitutus sp.]|nr:SCO family protein [Opitutus sp.]
MKTTPSAFCNLLGYNSPLFSLRRYGKCNLIGYTCRRAVLSAVAVVGLALSAAPAPAPCCPTEAATEAGDGRGLPAADFTRDSLYQLDATYTTDSGEPFRLARLRGRPVILTMFFASCNSACPLLVADITRLQAALPAPLRDEVAIVLVSFDVARDTPAALRKYREDRLLGPQWNLLHGDEDAVAELAALLGVKYKQETDGQFAHSNLITMLDAEGEIVHQRAGLQGGLVEAAAAIVLAHEKR